MKRFVLTLVATLVGAAALSAQTDKMARTELDERIDKALAYLKKEQNDDGTWSAGGGRRGRGGGHMAVTGLAVMAFLSAGHIPGEGPYGAVIEKGIRAVLREQAANGLLAGKAGGHHEMYTHGICTLMLAEVIGMTQGQLADDIRRALEKAIALILRAQRKNDFHRGGWRYQWNGQDSDVSVTGWQVMSLRAAKNVGCDVPPEAIDQAVDYIKRCYDPNYGGFRYMPNAHQSLACSGTSVLVLELCAAKDRSAEIKKMVDRTGETIRKHPLQYEQSFFFYGVYYCTQAMFQISRKDWKDEPFRDWLHKLLFRHQNANGSWIGKVADDQQIGPNYCTAMAVLALTVEYRFLPIYQRGHEPGDESAK